MSPGSTARESRVTPLTRMTSAAPGAPEDWRVPSGSTCEIGTCRGRGLIADDTGYPPSGRLDAVLPVGGIWRAWRA